MFPSHFCLASVQGVRRVVAQVGAQTKERQVAQKISKTFRKWIGRAEKWIEPANFRGARPVLAAAQETLDRGVQFWSPQGRSSSGVTNPGRRATEAAARRRIQDAA